MRRGGAWFWVLAVGTTLIWFAFGGYGLYDSTQSVDARGRITSVPSCRFVPGDDNSPGRTECRAVVVHENASQVVTVGEDRHLGDVIPVRLDSESGEIRGAGTVKNSRIAGIVVLAIGVLWAGGAVWLGRSTRRRAMIGR